MSLKDKGFRFCLSPDHKKARWLHALEFKEMYSDWIDVTDLEAKELERMLIDKLETKAP